MSKVKSFNEYHSVYEKGDKEESGASLTAPVAKTVVIDGVEYTAIPSTFKAIGEKQKDMGEQAVGMYSIPGKKEVYEIMKMSKKEDSGKESKEKEEKK
jgi:hypothetical protein